MDQQLSSNKTEKQVSNSTQRLSLQINDRRDSATSSSSRTLSPVAFFHDGFLTNETDLQKNLMGAQRRAQAIATAPRRKRYDDDDDNQEEDEAKKTLLRYIKTSSLPIPILQNSQHPHSLPQTESGANLLPTFRVDPPSQDDSGQLGQTFNYLNRCPSAPLPSRKEDWKD